LVLKQKPSPFVHDEQTPHPHNLSGLGDGNGGDAPLSWHQGCRASCLTPRLSWPAQELRPSQATDIQIRAKEVLANKATMIDILSNTGQPLERIAKDMDRLFYITPNKPKSMA